MIAWLIVLMILIANYKFLKRSCEAKRRASANSPALNMIDLVNDWLGLIIELMNDWVNDWLG